jgi:hypothetical protein
VPEQSRLDVLGPQWFGEQWVVHQVDLADRQIVRRTPVRVDQRQVRANGAVHSWRRHLCRPFPG